MQAMWPGYILMLARLGLVQISVLWHQYKQEPLSTKHMGERSRSSSQHSHVKHSFGQSEISLHPKAEVGHEARKGMTSHIGYHICHRSIFQRGEGGSSKIRNKNVNPQVFLRNWKYWTFAHSCHGWEVLSGAWLVAGRQLFWERVSLLLSFMRARSEIRGCFTFMFVCVHGCYGVCVLAGTPVLTLEGSGWSLGTSHGLELPTCEPWGGSADLNPECRKMQKGFIEQSCSKFKQRKEERFEREWSILKIFLGSQCLHRVDDGTNTSLPARSHLCFHGQVTKRFYVIPQRLFPQKDTFSMNTESKYAVVWTAHEHLAQVFCIQESAFCYATSHPKYASDLCLGHRNTAFRMLLHNSASTSGGPCTAVPAFSAHCLPDWEIQECCRAPRCAEVWPLWEPGPKPIPW